ncbi:class I SAM-dependent methyltransferase [Pendulispora albinea]|uniref:Methyltransferase domain-containing protein n=1 Tax=Pendulispora albinea TaxID=2741071 RepID=A0ABZ2LYV1_9BACT
MESNPTERSAMRRKLTDPYCTGILSKDLPTELARLQALERWADPTSKAIIQRLPMRIDWSCLEMGAGAGSMAYWLAERCPRGHVVAADIDPRYLDAGRAPNLEIATIDLVREGFPRASFDLIHTRLVLSHIPQRDEILKRAVTWLKPGGSIVVEDYYVLPLEHFPYEEMKRVFGAFVQTLSTQGSDGHWARRIPAKLASFGIGEMRIVSSPVTIGLGQPADEVWHLGFEQFAPHLVKNGSLTADQVAAYRALSKPDAIDVPWIQISVSGRRLKS